MFVKYIKDLVPTSRGLSTWDKSQTRPKLNFSPYQKTPSHPKANMWLRPGGSALCVPLHHPQTIPSQQATEAFVKETPGHVAARTCHTSPSLTFLSSIHRDGPPNPIEKLHIVRTFNVPTKVYHTYIAIFFHSRSILTALLLHLPSNLAFNWISPRPICCSSTEQKTLQ